MEKLYIVMPAYNEEENIEQVVAQWYPVVEKIGENSRLIIVNDGSKDHTYEMMVALKEKYPQFEPLTKLNSGHGATCLFAYNYAIEAGADYIFQTDSDGQTEPDEFWQFWQQRNRYDFIIGSRKERQDGFSRMFVTKVLKFVVWSVFHVLVDDANTPFRLMEAGRLKPIIKKIPADFFLSNVIISVLVVRQQEKSKWLPITFKERQGGVNSINLKRISKIGIKAIGDFRSIKRQL